MRKINFLIVLCMVSLINPSLLFADLIWTGCGISKKAYMSEMAAAFEKNSGIKIQLSGGGATKGIRYANNGKADLGGACRHLIVHDEESNVSLVIAGWDAIVVVVNKSNPISDISHNDLKAVLRGEITNWKKLGWGDHPIEVYVRKGKISGVGMMSRELIFADADVEFVSNKVFKSSGPLEKALEKSKWAIGLTGISSAKKRDLKVLDLNGIKPTMENLTNGNYILTRPLYIVTNKNRSSDVWAFLKFVRSPAGQAIIEGEGTVPANKAGNLLRQYRLLMKDIKGSQKGAFE